MYRGSARNKKGPSQSAWDAPSTPILFPCRGTVEKGTVIILQLAPVSCLRRRTLEKGTVTIQATISSPFGRVIRVIRGSGFRPGRGLVRVVSGGAPILY